MRINKIKIFLFSLTYAIMNLGKVVFADEPGLIKNPLKYDTFGGLIKGFSDLVTKIGIPIATVFIIWSGLLFVTARGNEDQLKKAKSTFYWTILGTAILVGAYALASAIVDFAGKL